MMADTTDVLSLLVVPCDISASTTGKNPLPKPVRMKEKCPKYQGLRNNIACGHHKEMLFVRKLSAPTTKLKTTTIVCLVLIFLSFNKGRENDCQEAYPKMTKQSHVKLQL